MDNKDFWATTLIRAATGCVEITGQERRRWVEVGGGGWRWVEVGGGGWRWVVSVLIVVLIVTEYCVERSTLALLLELVVTVQLY
jgi:hypothetical protein